MTGLNARRRHPSKGRQPASDVRLLTVDEVLAAAATGHRSWPRRAACAGDDPDRWWPDHGEATFSARLVCAGCPVVGDCRDLFLSDLTLDPDGVWAGVSGRELRAHTGRRSR